MSLRAVSDLPATTGWLWLKQGWLLMRSQPGALTALLFLNLMASALLSTIPLAGPFLAFGLVPCFSIALMQGCALVDQRRRVTLPVFATGFRQPLFARLVGIGGFYVLIGGIISVITLLFVDAEAVRQLFEALNKRDTQEIDPSPLLPLMIASFIELLCTLTLTFAAPLAAWQQMKAGKAVFYSIFATLRAAPAFAVLLLVWVGMLVTTLMFVTLLLGAVSATAAQVATLWLLCVYLLLLQCALYAAYRHMFGTPDLGLSD